MRASFIKAFPHADQNNCLDSDDREEIEIYDDNTILRCCIYKGAPGGLTYPYFKIRNPKRKTIEFIAIDNCILNDSDGEKCDFATHDNKTFYFVEIKKGLGSDQSRSSKKDKAISQLKSTLNLILPKCDFSKFRVLACICVGYNAPSPAAAASDLNLLVEFINEFNVELIEGNEIIFN